MNADKQEQTNEAIQGHSCFSSLPAYPRSSAFICGHSRFSFSPESQLSLPAYPRSSAFIRGHSCFSFSSVAIPASPSHPINIGSTSSVIAPSTRSLPNTLLTESPNSHKYSCRKHRSPITFRSSSKKLCLIRAHSVAGARIRSHSGPPRAHVSWKNPRLPFGVLISHNAPSLVASIGRIARYTSSLTRDASSTSNSRTAENPRIVASVPGSPTMRDPLGSASEISLSPSPVGRIFSLRTNPAAFFRNSPLCLALGLTTSVRLPLSVNAWWTALAAVIVDFPHCREQFRIPRLLRVPNTRACKASAPSPSSPRPHPPAPTGRAGPPPPVRRLRPPVSRVFHIPIPA